MKTIFKFMSLIFAGLFLWAAYVQYNDPDTLLWIAIYVAAAVVSLLFYLDKLHFLVPLFLGMIYLVEAMISWPDVFEGVTIGAGNIVNIERGREALGLLILASVMFTYAIRIKMVEASKI
jgi:hypothetical protein